ncbi:MAG: CotH kinase family protein [Marinilabiliaceae bacterium]|nr:CotH kinase family protein [Marinilabiliaceae bacterium]
MRLLITLSTVFLISVFSIKSQIVINELSSSNYNGLHDETGEPVDWIELYNLSENAVNIGGLCLSDDSLNLLKWQFPNYLMGGNSFLTICASDKDLVDLPLIWNTVINWGDTLSYIVPTSNIDDGWKSLGFDDYLWNKAPGGIGYGDGDDSTVIDTCISVFIRKEFEVDDLGTVKRLIMHLDYDDGFVAYLNGVEIARSYLGYSGVPSLYNDLADGHEASIYKGMPPEQFEIYNATGILVQGTNVLAIQVHNNYAASSDLTAIPFLTIGYSSHSVKTKIHKYFKADRLYFHTNFKLNDTGEALYLSSPSGVIIDKIEALSMSRDVSYGRYPDGNQIKGFFQMPSPGETNNNNPIVKSLVFDSVKFSHIGGCYPNGFYLELLASDSLDRIFFTTNGDEPTEMDILYTNPINISADTIIKARIFRDEALPGAIVSNTYILSRKHKFPITCLSTDTENLWDEQTGIYVAGLNAEEDMPHYGANYWEDWEKPAHFEMFDTLGEKVIDQNVGIKIYGNYTRTHPQKSLALFARKKYGRGSFNYPFFADKNIDTFESVVLRNSGQDGSYSMFRDGLCSILASNMDIDRIAYRPTAHYLNGKYWGILNIREKHNEHFLADNHLFNTDDLTVFKSDEVLMGVNTDYKEMLSFIETNNLNSSENYQVVLDKIDVNSYIQYQLTEIYIDNGDWPGNNLKFWRVNTPDSKWRWVLFDADYTFGLYYWNGYTHNTLAIATDSTSTKWPNPEWSTRLFRRLLTSSKFRNEFINQYCDQLNTTFTSENIFEVIDSLQNMFDGEIQMHLQRWGLSYSDYLYHIGKVREYASLRPEYAWQHITETFGLGNNKEVVVSVNDNNMGMVKMHSMVVDQPLFTGYYYQNVPIHLKALPKPGYKFVKWEGSVVSADSYIEFDMADAGSFIAVFDTASEKDIDIVINEINYKSADNFDTEDWIELYNNGSATVDLGGWKLTDLSSDPAYFFPRGTVLYPGDYLVVCDEIREFRNYRTSRRNSIGNFEFGLSKNGDVIRLYNSKGELKDSIDYTSYVPWPVIENETGGTIELIQPYLDNSKPLSWIINNSKGTPGAQNLGVHSSVLNRVGKNIDLNVSCFPNPFVDYTTIEFRINNDGLVILEVLNINGQHVNVLVNQHLNSDKYYFDWDGTNYSGQVVEPGIYFIRCQSGKNSIVQKVIKK